MLWLQLGTTNDFKMNKTAFQEISADRGEQSWREVQLEAAHVICLILTGLGIGEQNHLSNSAVSMFGDDLEGAIEFQRRK